MTKSEIIALVRNHISGGSVVGDLLHKTDPRVIELYVAAAYQDIVYEVFRTDQSGLSLYAKSFMGVEVAADAVTGLYMSELPEAIIQLPGVASAVRSIRFDVGTELVFVPLEADLMESMKMLDAGNYTVNPTIGYCLRGTNSIEFMNFPLAEAAETLRIDLVIPFTAFSASEQVHLPSGKVSVLIEAVIELLTGRPRVDLKNDNAETENK